MNITTLSGKEIEVKFNAFRTRKVDREYQMALSENVVIGTDGQAKFPASNVQKANDVLVMGMTNLTQAELDDISAEDYNSILAKINEEDEKKSSTKK